MGDIQASLRRLGRGIVLACFLAAALPSAGSAEEPAYAYLHGIEDLPLMPGLTEVEEAGIVFDKPAGRIVVAFAEGEASETDVLDFYTSTLPQLGWRLENKATFQREGEVLHIEFEPSGQSLLVRFSLSPN
ncbi:MAG: hypothetical protein ACPHIA_03990 [Alphaproteobacteria bacterium]